MALIDPRVTFRKVEERLETESDPVLRRNLETLLTHMKAEMAGDVDGLLVTLTDDVHYHAYGSDDPVSNPVGRDQVRAFYDRFIGSGAGQLQLDIDRLVVDKECILTEGLMRIVYPGRTLRRWVSTSTTTTPTTCTRPAWPRSGRSTRTGSRGEDTYTGGDGFAGIADRKLAPDDIVQYVSAG